MIPVSTAAPPNVHAQTVGTLRMVGVAAPIKIKPAEIRAINTLVGHASPRALKYPDSHSNWSGNRHHRASGPPGWLPGPEARWSFTAPPLPAWRSR
ncbi:hypothetical protein MAIC_56180 [Mycolicibacterium aichiense]|uniref:Uncharacterized protein n=1 Tax=Mycolicibacterium aichiense TaxID=1799 RepID=A0AAD1MFN7_9MYCO|nr:hypothetical protein MAIC_56180 [Mycolicibacterium aichiense]